MQIKNIIFDMGGVLADLDQNRCLNSFKLLGFKGIEQFVDSYSQTGIFSDLETGKISVDEFLRLSRQFCEFPDQVSDEQIIAAWESFIIEIPQKKLDQIAELRKNFKIYLLSNTNAIHFPSIEEKYQLSKYFDHCYVSYEVGLAKPGAEIFEYLLKDAGIKAEESLFIDDSAANIATAAKLGFKTYKAAEKEDFSQLFLTLQPL